MKLHGACLVLSYVAKPPQLASRVRDTTSMGLHRARVSRCVLTEPRDSWPRRLGYLTMAVGLLCTAVLLTSCSSAPSAARKPEVIQAVGADAADH